MPRESFKNLAITKNLGNTLMELNNTMLEKQEFFKMRTLVFEIITVIWIDDFQDNYLDSLELICKKIKDSCFGSKEIKRVISYFFQNI